MTIASTDIDIQLYHGTAHLSLQDEQHTDLWELTTDELATLADRATEALAASKGWEFTMIPVIAVEPGNLLAFTELPVVAVDTERNGYLTVLYFEDQTSATFDSEVRVTILRRIA